MEVPNFYPTLTYRGILPKRNGRGNKRKSRSVIPDDLIEMDSGLWLNSKTGDVWLIQR